jgi:SAM-dependent methyltransferase
MAPYYDTIYHNIVDYKQDCTFLERILKIHRGTGKIQSILDAGCGTGNHAFILAKKGYHVTGLDLSSSMIKIAKSKRRGLKNPQFFEMDMRHIRLPRAKKLFDAVVSMFGGFGYLLRDSDVGSFFSSVKRNISRDGLLYFEFWQSSAVGKESRAPSGFKIWVRASDKRRGWLIIRLGTSRFDSRTKLMTLNFDGYVLDIKRKSAQDSFSEVHNLRTYSLAEIKKLLIKNELTPLAFYNASSNESEHSLTRATASDFRVACAAKLAN